jgi:hypothetical protein
VQASTLGSESVQEQSGGHLAVISSEHVNFESVMKQLLEVEQAHLVETDN